MRKKIFVDTAAGLALVNKSDNDHRKAKEIRDDLLRLQRQFVVTDYVVVEVANALSKIPFRAAVKLVNSTQRDRLQKTSRLWKLKGRYTTKLGRYFVTGLTKNGA